MFSGVSNAKRWQNKRSRVNNELTLALPFCLCFLRRKLLPTGTFLQQLLQDPDSEAL